MPSNLDLLDKATQLFSRAAEILFIDNPQKTSLGVVLGIIINGTVDIVLQITQYSLNISPIFFICSGIFILHLPSIFSKHRISKDIETPMHYLRELQKNGNFSEAEKRAQWRRLVELVYQKVSVDLENANQKGSEDSENKIEPIK